MTRSWDKATILTAQSYWHMAELKCDDPLKKSFLENQAKQVPCNSPNRYCVICLEGCCVIVPQKPLSQIWDTWYLWMGIALVVFVLITSVSFYFLQNSQYTVSISLFKHPYYVLQRIRKFHSSIITKVQVSLSCTSFGLLSDQYTYAYDKVTCEMP